MKLISTLCFCLLSVLAFAQSNDFETLVKMPQYPGGTMAMRQFIAQELKYPEEGILYEREGTVIASFTIGTNGEISDIDVKDHGINCETCLAEAKRVIAAMPPWQPGESANGLTNARMNVPITFKLGKEEKRQRNKLLRKMSQTKNEAPAPSPKPSIPETIYFMLENDQYVQTTLDQEPEYIDGEEAKSRIIWMNIRYPAMAREKRIQGNVLITVFLDEQGQMQDVQITKGIGGGCDEEALKVIKLLQPKGFTPAIKDGKAVAVKFDIPIVFRLP